MTARHRAAVCGRPIGHSLSPVIHNAAAAALGVDLVYVPLPVRLGEMRAAVDGIRSLGFVGANVTMPHKESAADLADDASDDVRLLGAGNTLVVAEDGVRAENTDAPGFDRFLRRDVAFDPAGRSALVFGAGGVGSAIAASIAAKTAATIRGRAWCGDARFSPPASSAGSITPGSFTHQTTFNGGR